MEGTIGFEEKLTLLLDKAKKKKNVLEYQEVMDFFGEDRPSGEKLDQLFDFLDQNKVDILRLDAWGRPGHGSVPTGRDGSGGWG